MPTSRTFGAVTVTALHDGQGLFFKPRAEAFPGASAEHWRRADERDPATVRDGEWLLPFRCFALRLDDGPVVLVDTGIGAADAPAARWAPVPGQLPAELAAAGIAPAEVDTVVLTHMHTDHVGWAVDGALPYFGNARYLMQRTEVDTIERTNPELAEWLLVPLRSAGQLDPIDGDLALGGGVRVVATPGHTPGHQSVVLETGGDSVLFTGDLLVHMVQLIDPDQPYALEVDADAARVSRIALLDELRARGNGVLASAHLGEPFVALAPGA